MKEKISLLLKRILAITLAIVLALPTQIFASQDIGKSHVENQNLTSINESQNIQRPLKISDSGETLLTKENEDYNIETDAKLDPSLKKILYTIKLSRKNKISKNNEETAGETLEGNIAKNISLSLIPNPNSSIKNLKLVSAKAITDKEELDLENQIVTLDENKNELENKNETQNNNELIDKKDLNNELKPFEIKTQLHDELVYTVEGEIEKIKDADKYNLAISIKEEDKENILFNYNLISEKINLLQGKEIQESITIKINKKEESNLKGIYKKENSNENSLPKDTILWTDYLSNDSEKEKEFDYKFNLDSNQKTENSKINIEYYEHTDEGFKLREDFSENISYAEEIKISVPKGFIAKISLDTKVEKKNTDIKNYFLNNNQLENPLYVKPVDKKDLSTNENKNSETNSQETNKENSVLKNGGSGEKLKESTTQIETSNSKKVESEKEDTKDTLEETSSQNGTSEIEKEKGTDTSKGTAETDKEKEKTRIPLTNKENVKKFDKAVEELQKDKAGLIDNEKSLVGNIVEGVKSIFGSSNLQKADKELKEALADTSKTLEEIQNLLLDLGNKYKLTRSDQAKLMSDNEDAIRVLVERDADENFRPNFFPIRESRLAEKKFPLQTEYQVDVSSGPILVGQFFKLHLDKTLMVKNPNLLPDLKNPITGEVVARPKYDKSSNTITYTIVKRISSNVNIPIKIDLDYNPANFPKGENEITIINRVSGMGVLDSKTLPPVVVDSEGNVKGIIQEPGRHDIHYFTKPGSPFKVNINAEARPIIENNEMTDIEWTVTFDGNGTSLSSSHLNMSANFTAVEGSGLGEIRDVSLNGKSITLEKNNMGNSFLIKDSKYYPGTENSSRWVFKFKTRPIQKQTQYALDVTGPIKGQNEVGAARLIMNEGWPLSKVKIETPSRVGMNNRTTVMGEFKSNSTMRWVVTDAVSTGDNGILPINKNRNFTGDQKITSMKAAVYGLDSNGKMVQKTSETTFNNQSQLNAFPQGKQDIGNIAVYEYKTQDLTPDTGEESYSLSGVSISKYDSWKMHMTWDLLNLNKPMPAQKVIVKSADGKYTKTHSLTEDNSKPSERTFDVPGVRIWNIDENGKATKIDNKVIQEFPANFNQNGKEYAYKERSLMYSTYYNDYRIINTIIDVTKDKLGDITIKKVDSKKNTPLEGAVFELLSGTSEKSGLKIETGSDGKASFRNLSPGTYSFIETKAPVGYNLDPTPRTLTVNKDGTVSLTNAVAKVENSSQGSQTRYLMANSNWESFMNTMDYAVKDGNQFTYYILLKAKPNQGLTGSGTDRNSKIYIDVTQGSVTEMKLYDVSSQKKKEIANAMMAQTVDSQIANLSEMTNNQQYYENRINITVGTDLSGQGWGQVWQANLPKARFAGDWSYLAVIKGTITGNRPEPKFHWIADDKSSKILSKRTDFSSASDKKEVVYEIANTKLIAQDIELTKVDTNGNPVAGAEFSLEDENGRILAVKTSNASGKINFGKYSQGLYKLKEINPPDGHHINPLIFDVKVLPDGTIEFQAKNKKGDLINSGDRHRIKLQEIKGGSIPTNIKVLEHKPIKIEEKRGIGHHTGKFEVFKLESLYFMTKVQITGARPGVSFTIQFDPNLDFGLYTKFGNKHLNKNGVQIADQYVDLKKNTITYVLTSNVEVGSTQVLDIIISDITPSIYYAKNNRYSKYDDPNNPSVGYKFTNIVNPGPNESRVTTTIPVIYEEFFGARAGQPASANFFVDFWKDKDGNYYTKTRGYYNAFGKRNYPSTKIAFDYDTMENVRNKPKEQWIRLGKSTELYDFKIYKIASIEEMQPPRGGATADQINAFYEQDTELTPHSMGVKPEEDPLNYRLITHFKPRYNAPVRTKNEGVEVDFDPNREYKGLINAQSATNGPIEVWMPNTGRNGDRYLIEQVYKITDINKFLNHWRHINMEINFPRGMRMGQSNQGRGGYTSLGAESTKPNIPKIYTEILEVENTKYIPGKFEIKKVSLTDSNKVLKDAEFILRDDNGNITRRMSDGQGKIIFDKIRPGNYTLEESLAPSGYELPSKKWNVIVNDKGEVRISEIGVGVDSTIYKIDPNKPIIPIIIRNKPSGARFRLVKKGENGENLKGAKFKITKENDPSFNLPPEISGADGVVNFTDLGEGTYILEEIEAPAGYEKLNKKYKIIINADREAKIYEYIENPQNNPDTGKGLMNNQNIYRVDVSKRSISDFATNDNRLNAWTTNSQQPYKMGTRIIGINTNEKYFIQRYVINPECEELKLVQLQIHREKPSYSNMNWYAGNEEIKVYKLDKAITEANIEDIRLGRLNSTDITNATNPTTNKRLVEISTRPEPYGNENFNRLILNLPATKTPYIVDIKVPYNDVLGGIGTGMDAFLQNEGSDYSEMFWKSDFYGPGTQPVKGESARPSGGLSTTGSYIATGFMDITNRLKRADFKIVKVDDRDKAKTIQGAVFSLKGPEPSEEDRVITTDSNGVGTFTELLPGKYKLEEVTPAPGYAKSPTTWTVIVNPDLSISMTADDGSNPDIEKPNKRIEELNPGNDFETVNPYGTDKKKENKPNTTGDSSSNRVDDIDTRIVQWSKNTKKVRQVFLINKGSKTFNNPIMDLEHKDGYNLYFGDADPATIKARLQNRRYLKDSSGNPIKNVNISIYEVTKDSTLGNLVAVGDKLNYTASTTLAGTLDNPKTQIRLNLADKTNKTLAVVVEVEYPADYGDVAGKIEPVGNKLTVMPHEDQGNYSIQAEEWYDSPKDISVLDGTTQATRPNVPNPTPEPRPNPTPTPPSEKKDAEKYEAVGTTITKKFGQATTEQEIKNAINIKDHPELKDRVNITITGTSLVGESSSTNLPDGTRSGEFTVYVDVTYPDNSVDKATVTVKVGEQADNIRYPASGGQITREYNQPVTETDILNTVTIGGNIPDIKQPTKTIITNKDKIGQAGTYDVQVRVDYKDGTTSTVTVKVNQKAEPDNIKYGNTIQTTVLNKKVGDTITEAEIIAQVTTGYPANALRKPVISVDTSSIPNCRTEGEFNVPIMIEWPDGTYTRYSENKTVKVIVKIKYKAGWYEVLRNQDSGMINNGNVVNSGANGIGVETAITHVDKLNKKFRQVFILHITNGTNTINSPRVEIHSWPENRNLNLQNIRVVDFRYVENGATPYSYRYLYSDNHNQEIGTNSENGIWVTRPTVITSTKKYRWNNGWNSYIQNHPYSRVLIDANTRGAKGDRSIVLVVEANLPSSHDYNAPFGLGVDYYYEGRTGTTDIKENSKIWRAQQIMSLDRVKIGDRAVRVSQGRSRIVQNSRRVPRHLQAVRANLYAVSLASLETINIPEVLVATGTDDFAISTNENAVSRLRVANSSVNTGFRITPRAAGEFTISNNTATIENTKIGIDLVVNKKDYSNIPLSGAKFLLQEVKYSINAIGNQETKKIGQPIEVTSDSNGRVVFTKLTEGNYELTELEAPHGYKKQSGIWKLQVANENGRLVIKETSSEKTLSEFMDELPNQEINFNSNEAFNISSKIVRFDPIKKTFTQRFFINPKANSASGTYRIEINPTKDTSRAYIKYGVETHPDSSVMNYRTTYRVQNPKAHYFENPNANQGAKNLKNVLDLSSPDIEQINSARFRPAIYPGTEKLDSQGNPIKGSGKQYGFDQDRLYLSNSFNGNPVGYIIDVDANFANYNGETYPNELGFKLDFKKTKTESRHKKNEKGEYLYDKNNRPVYEDVIVDAVEFPPKDSSGNVLVLENLADKNEAYKTSKLKEYNDAINKYERDSNAYTTDAIKTNIAPVYTSSTYKQIPYTGLEVYNEEETYNITFTKYEQGKDEYNRPPHIDPANKENDKDPSDKTVRLEGAVFKLQRLEYGVYSDVGIVSSAFNGYIGFNGLTKGSYQLIEVKPPKGYKAIQGAIVKFDVVKPEKGATNQTAVKVTEFSQGSYISVKDPKNQIPDFLTGATGHGGKLLNMKPGQGKVEIKKTDGTKPLEGAKFRLTKLTKMAGAVGNTASGDQGFVEIATSGADGMVRFKDLPLGHYMIEEIEAPAGYMRDKTVRYFTVGGKELDPFAEKVPTTGQDVSGLIEFKNSKLAFSTNPSEEVPSGSSRHVLSVNEAQSLIFSNIFKIKPNASIQPGDFFEIFLTDNMNLKGIDLRETTNLDILAEGVGTIAHGEYIEDNRGRHIRYTFSNYAKTYNLIEFSNVINTYIDEYKVKDTNWVNLGLSMNPGNAYRTNVYTYFTNYQSYTSRNYDTGFYDISLSTRLFRMNPDTGDFVSYAYINKTARNGAKNLSYHFRPYKDDPNISDSMKKEIGNVRMEVYRLKNKALKNQSMPNSWGIDFNDRNIEKIGDSGNTLQDRQKVYSYHFDNNQEKMLDSNIYIVKVTGKILDEDSHARKQDKESFRPFSYLQANWTDYYRNWWGNIYDSVNRNMVVDFGNYAVFNKNDATAKTDFVIKMENRENGIEFTKINQFYEPIQGAEFRLERTYISDGVEKTESYKTDIKTGADGKITFKKLPYGTYWLYEMKAPEGYKQVSNILVKKFKVDENGKLTVFELKYGIEEEVDIAAADLNIKNEKEFNFNFTKRDVDNQASLDGAEFDVYYKEGLVDNQGQKIEYQKDNSFYGIRSDNNGNFNIKVTKPGYYAIKETKAPKGYKFTRDYIKEFALIDGQMLEKVHSDIKVENQDMLIGANQEKVAKITLTINPDKKDLLYRKSASILEIIPSNLDLYGKVDVEIQDKAGQTTKATNINLDASTLTNLNLNRLIHSAKKNQNIAENSPELTDITTSDSIRLSFTLRYKVGNPSFTSKLRLDGAGMYFSNLVETRDINLDKLTNEAQYYSNYATLKTSVNTTTKILENTERINIYNKKTTYPKTGGRGVKLFIYLGLSLMAVAFIDLRRKRKPRFVSRE